MAKQLYAFSLICGILLFASCEAAPAKANATDQADPWDRLNLPPQPRPGYYKYLGECIDKLTRPCGAQIFDYIYGKAVVDKSCCQKIKDMGQTCSKSLSLTLSQSQKYKLDAQLIIKKSDEVYVKCVKGESTPSANSKTSADAKTNVNSKTNANSTTSASSKAK